MMPLLSLAELTPGSYRWYYADVTAGDLTAVAIFMVGAVFSPGYAAATDRGVLPIERCAVNFALYRGGVRQLWVFSEYGTATLGDAGRSLQVGRSSLRHGDDGRITIELHDRTAPWGRPVTALLSLWPESDAVEAVALLPDQPHHWQPLAPRCHAVLDLPGSGLAVDGRGYHDTNWGTEPLGGALPGWEWTRVQGRDTTEVRYLPRGAAGDELHLTASPSGSRLVRTLAGSSANRRTGWGLAVPRALSGLGSRFEAPALLESSPFYARLEAHRGAEHALGEVADFEKFRRPYYRWMAHFRSRKGVAA